MRYIGDGKPLTRALAWRSIAAMIGHWHLRGYGYWATEERVTGIRSRISSDGSRAV